MRRPLLLVLVLVSCVGLLATPATAEDVEVPDPEGDVAFPRGDIASFRTNHGSGALDLRARTVRGGEPLFTWPNLATYVEWRIDTSAATVGPEYVAQLRLVHGFDTVFLGRVRRLLDNAITCSAQDGEPGPVVVDHSQNRALFRFPRGCIGSPPWVRIRVLFHWDPGAAGGPTEDDYAPGPGPTARIYAPV